MYINPSFSSQKLYDAKIRHKKDDGTKETINAQITKLSYDDPEDSSAMMIIALKWRSMDEYFNPKYFDNIHFNFKTKFANTLAIELVDDSKKLENKIVCLASISDNEVEYLQARPDAEYKPVRSDSKRKYYGAGKALMQGIFQYIKYNKFNEVTVNSANDKFYNAIGMKPAPELNPDSRFNYYKHKLD